MCVGVSVCVCMHVFCTMDLIRCFTLVVACLVGWSLTYFIYIYMYVCVCVLFVYLFIYLFTYFIISVYF